MTRVSENSSTASIKFALNKTKSKLEDLQLKGSTLKAISRPSDNPVANIESLTLSSRTSDNKQYVRNADYALLQLSVTERSLEEVTDLLTKAKEIAISQASDFYNADVRKTVANEIIQLRNMAMSIANKRVGQKYIFGGYKTLSKPFAEDGTYNGDRGRSTLEISKDFFIPTNLHGEEIFFSDAEKTFKQPTPLEDVRKDREQLEMEQEIPLEGSIRTPAATSENPDGFKSRSNIFSHLDSLVVALENDDSTAIQDLLEKFDEDIERTVRLRTRIGSIVNSIDRTKNILDAENINAAERNSKLVDADLGELFSDITKQQNILQTTYKASQTMMNQNLLDFLR